MRFFTIFHLFHAKANGQCLTGWKTPYLGYSHRKQGETNAKIS